MKPAFAWSFFAFPAAQRAGACLLAAVMLSMAGCKKNDMQTEASAMTGPVPTRQQIVEAHNQRVAKLATTHSDGVIELRWRDERGKHSEQGDLELWQTTDNRTAVDISKIGERLLWMGSSGDQCWLFDLMDKHDRVLYVGSQEQLGERFGALGVKPLALLDLLGMSPIPESPASERDEPLTFDKSLGALVLETNGRGGRLRMAFDQATLLPMRIELLDAAGVVAATSMLSRYASASVPGLPIMALPKMPLTIDIQRAATEDGDLAGDAKIALNETIGEIKDKVASQIFDLDRLVSAMRPDRVEPMLRVAGP